MISEFSLEHVHKAGARFDIEKAKWFNQQYLSKVKDNSELMKSIDFGSTFKYDDVKKNEIIELAKKRSTFVGDLQPVVNIFTNPVVVDAAAKSRTPIEYKTVFTEFVNKMDSIDWIPESIHKLIGDICTEKDIKMGKIMPALRVALTGGVPGPDLMTTASILGKEETKVRISSLL